MKQEYFVAIFLFLLKIVKFQKKIENPLPHLDVDFNLVEFLPPAFKLLRHDLKTCCHLMLNPSWDASQ
jgi:hypothetical protein